MKPLVQENGPLPMDVSKKLTAKEQNGPHILVRMHPACIAWPVLRTVLTFAAIAVVGSWVASAKLFLFMFVLWFIFFGIRGLLSFANWAVDYFVVTTDRVVLITGLLDRKTAMMPLAKVTDMTMEQPLFGRLFGYGVFVIESAGQDQALRTVPFVPDPEYVDLWIVNLINPDQGDD